MLDNVIKFIPGQVINGFRIEGYEQRRADAKGLPVYRVRCTRCQTQTTMSHRHTAIKCRNCEMNAARAAMVQPPNIMAKLEAVKAYDQSVEQNYAAAQLTKGEKVNPETPQAPQPKPIRQLSRLARIAIEEARLRGWSWDDIQQAKLEEL